MVLSVWYEKNVSEIGAPVTFPLEEVYGHPYIYGELCFCITCMILSSLSLSKLQVRYMDVP